MMTLKMTTKLMALTLVMPLIQSCSKSRYEQVNGRGPLSPGFIQQQAPQPMIPNSGSISNAQTGTRFVPPAPRFTPAPDTSGEEGDLPEPEEAPVRVVVPSNSPAPKPVEVPRVQKTLPPDSQWMDPTRYPHAVAPSRPVPVAQPVAQPAPQPIARPVAAPQPRPVAERPRSVQPRPQAAAPAVAPQAPARLEYKHDVFQQTAAAQVNKMDILFVVDTSESIMREREAAAANIDQLIQQLPSDIDYNVGVMLAHSSGTDRDGELFRSRSNEPIVLKSKEMKPELIRASLNLKLTQFPGDRNSDGGELGLYSLMKAIRDSDARTSAKAARAANLGMFRADAAQVIIFISDENDLCTRVTSDSKLVKADPNGDEIPAVKRFCRGITPQSVYNMLAFRRDPGYNTYQGNSKQTTVLPVLIAAMVYTNPATVPARTTERWAAENEVGYGYLEMVRLNGGVAIDLANIDMTQALSRIGAAAHGKLVKEVSHQATQGQVDFNTVCTLIDDREVPYGWDATEKRLTARGLARPGSRVEFMYSLDNGRRDQSRYDEVQIDPRCKALRQRFNR